MFSLLCSLTNIAQIAGDVTGDDIIDATDFMELHQIISGEKDPTYISDVNKDGETNVADLLILENYIYREGQAPEHGGKKEVKTELTLTPGLVDPNEKSIEIVLENNGPIAAFQLEFMGIESIASVTGGLLEKSGMKFSFKDKRLYAILDQGNEIKAGKNVLFKMFFNGEFDEVCISKPVFCNYNSEKFIGHIGQCANATFTEEGCEHLKEVVLGKAEADKYSDVNKDGYVTMSDLQIVENFLYRNGPPPPGEDLTSKNKVKLELENVDNHNRTFDVSISTKESVAGFQLSFDGVQGLDIKSGVAFDNDMEMHGDGNKVIVLTGKGTIIPPGKQSLLKVSYSDTTSSQLCLFNPLFIGPNAVNYSLQLGECQSLIPIIPGCMDSLALNYDPKANKDDGSCEYPPPPPKPPKPPKEKKEKPEKEKKPDKEKVETEEELTDLNEDVKEEKPKKEKKDKKSKEDSIGEEESELKKSEDEKEPKKKKSKKSEEKDELADESSEEEKPKKEKTKKKKEEVKEVEKNDQIEEAPVEKKLEKQETNLEEVDEAILVPKLSSVERMNIANPKKGQMVYDTDADAFIFYDGKTWRVVGNGDKQASGFEVKRKGKKWLPKNTKK